MNSKNTGKKKNDFATEADKIKALKQALVLALALILVLAGLIMINRAALSDYKQITSGTYYNENECLQKYGPAQTYINVSISKIKLTGDAQIG